MSIIKRVINYLFPTDMYQVGYDEATECLKNGWCGIADMQNYLDDQVKSSFNSKYDMGVRAAMYDRIKFEVIKQPAAFMYDEIEKMMVETLPTECENCLSMVEGQEKSGVLVCEICGAAL